MDNIADNFPDISFIDDSTIEEIQEEMVNDYRDKYKELTGKEALLGQANPYRLILYACAIQIYQGMQYADYAGKMSFLKYARGDYLDNLGALKGVSRIEATSASTVLQFTVEAPIALVVAIPAGTRVTNGNDVYFATDEYAEIPAGDTSITVSATCTEAGTVGNDFEAGEFNILVNTLAYVSEVTNTVKTSGGADAEDDDSLRDRIYNAPNAYSVAGPDGAYEYHTKLVDSSISDVVVSSDMPGEVDVCIICNGGELPSDALIAEVEEYLMDDNVRPLTDNVIVSGPSTVTYDVDFTYYISESNKSAVASIQDLVNTAVDIYNSWQTEKIGRDINPSYLIQQVMQAGAKRVEITSPTFTSLTAKSIAQLGTVTVTYGGLEDD